MEISAGRELARVGIRQVLRATPQWVLRLAYPKAQAVERIRVEASAQGANFWVGENRLVPEFSAGGLTVWNRTPLKLYLVGADLRVVVSSQEWLRYEKRFPSISEILPEDIGGFHLTMPIESSGLLTQIRTYPRDWVRMDIRGCLVFHSVYGEVKKELHTTMMGIIDR